MKTRNILIVAMLLIASWAHAQYNAQNYVRTNVFRKEVTVAPTVPDTSQAVQSTQYYDGLGRPIQTVVKQGSPDGKDLVNQIGYDTYGRQHKTYLPYEASHSFPGNYHGNWQSEINTFYNDANNGVANESSYYYNETMYENSPLSRPVKAYGAGSAWRTADKYVSTVFDYNNAADAIPHFDVDTDASQTVTYVGLYADGELTKTVTYDEDGNRTEEFKDKLGRVLTKKTKIDASNDAITHYLYDDYGQLTFVIQPQGVIEGGTAWNTNLNSTAFRKNWMFRYRYDWRGQVIEKQVPGSEPFYMIYDRRGRVRMTQSGNERIGQVVTGDIEVDQFTGKSYEIQGSGSVTLKPGFSVVASGSTEFEATTQGTVAEKWIVTKYDDADRPVMTGFYYTSDSKETLTQTVFQSAVYGESYTGSGPLEGYTNNVFPAITEENLLTVTYYDNYDFAADKASIIPSNALEYPKGLVTGALTRILGQDQLLRIVTFYDDRERSIKSVAENHKNGADVVVTTYRNSVSQIVQKTMTEHTSDDFSGILKVTENFNYDHADRIVSATHQINNGSLVKLSETQYNPIGESVQKKIGSENGGAFVQTLDYEYNIRGWLTKINDPITLSGENKFGMQLDYTSSGFYNGNIGKMAWKTDGLSAQDYTYTYDATRRLKSAVYNSSNNSLDTHFNVNNINYDANGNILGLTRFKSINGTKREIDRLSYNYGLVKSNQLIGVIDQSPEASSYKDDGFMDDGDNSDYNYDDNGNVIADDNKDIVSINYNHMNLPELVLKGNGDYVKYLYDAAGIKLRTEEKVGGNLQVADYIGNNHFVNNSLSFLNHTEGRARYVAGSFHYEYKLTDHLGNVRVTLNNTGDIIQRNDYYPFGLTFNSIESSPENLYKYNGFEQQKSWEVYDYKARYYDPSTARFLMVDPAADLMRRHSPYNYAFDNPITFIDPDGMKPSLGDLFGDSLSELVDKTANAVVSEVKTRIVNTTKAVIESGKEYLREWEGSFYFKTEASGNVGPRGALNAKGVGVDAGASFEAIAFEFEKDNSPTEDPDFRGPLTRMDSYGEMKKSKQGSAAMFYGAGYKEEVTENTEGEVIGNKSEVKQSVAYGPVGFTQRYEDETTEEGREQTIRLGFGVSGSFGLFGVVDGEMEVGYKVSRQTEEESL